MLRKTVTKKKKILKLKQVQVQVQVHLFTLIQLQYNNNKEKKEEIKKTELTIHGIKHNKGKECVASKGAKLSSWPLPHSGYKWVEVIQY